MTVDDQLKEARALAAMLCAYGHPECRRRIGEALRGEMPDKDRIPMLRYDFGEILEASDLLPELRIRLQRFVDAT